jgi:hypothetical protein
MGVQDVRQLIDTLKKEYDALENEQYVDGVDTVEVQAHKQELVTEIEKYMRYID